MKEIVLLKCGEMVLKGQNRRQFEDQLLKNLRRRLRAAGCPCAITVMQSTIYVEPEDPAQTQAVVDVASRVFGLVGICRAAVCRKELGDIIAVAKEYLADTLHSITRFKVETRRSDKKFPLKSPQISCEVGGELQDAFPHLIPDMEHPDEIVYVEVRDQNAFVYCGRLPGAGGMPVGANGRGMLLLSGGIDSPVAGYMMAKRGVELNAVHFFSYPYTSEQAKEKVIDLARLMSRYTGRIYLHVVGFTAVQEAIRDHCPNELFTVIMRRMMMRIAEKLADRYDCGALITGESLGQVASQTMEALGCTDEVCTRPALRPLIGMDKEEIIRLSRKIGTFETSILPYEDCCTVFTPRHPTIHPKRDKVHLAEQGLEVDALVEQVERLVIE